MPYPRNQASRFVWLCHGCGEKTYGIRSNGKFMPFCHNCATVKEIPVDSNEKMFADWQTRCQKTATDTKKKYLP